MNNIITAEEVKSNTNIQNLVTDSLFDRTINAIFTKYFKTILGDYYTNIMDKLKDGEELSEIELEIVNELKLSLSYYILSENIMNLMVKITKGGIVQLNNAQYTTISINDINTLKSNYLHIANDLRKQFIDWFSDNIKVITERQKDANKNLGGFILPIRRFKDYPSDNFKDKF